MAQLTIKTDNSTTGVVIAVTELEYDISSRKPFREVMIRGILTDTQSDLFMPPGELQFEKDSPGRLTLTADERYGVFGKRNERG